MREVNIEDSAPERARKLESPIPVLCSVGVFPNGCLEMFNWHQLGAKSRVRSGCGWGDCWKDGESAITWGEITFPEPS